MLASMSYSPRSIHPNMNTRPSCGMLARSARRWASIYNASMIDGTEIIQRLHDSEINAMVSWFFDGEFRWSIGDEFNGWRLEGRAESARQTLLDLAENVFAEFPRS